MRLHKLAKRLTAALVSSAMAFSLCAPALALSGSGPSEYDAIELTAEFFPDEAFRTYLAEEVDKDGNNVLSSWERSSVTSMRCDSKGIASLEGIQYFTNLTELYCCADRLTGLDLSGCPQLKELYCCDTPLTSLDVSVCPSLTVLECQRMQLTALDVSANKSLRRLCCYNNRLTELDVSQNAELSNLQCDSNQLTRLDVGANPKLSYLTCGKNQLTELDVSLQPGLCQLLVSGNPITKLDLSRNPGLYLLWCENTPLTCLDLSNNPEMRNLHFSGSPLLRLDLAPGTQLREPENLVSEITLTENKLEDGRYDLHDLPGFDPDLYRGWTGGTVDENGILTVAEGNTDHKVSCTYTGTGALTVVLDLHLHALQWQYDELSHWQICAADGFATEKTLHTFDEEHGTHCTECPYDQGAVLPDGPADDGQGDAAGVGAMLAGGAVAAGAAGIGLYELITRMMLKKLLPAGAAIPKTQGELALLLWQTAGCPDTVTPPPADTEDAKAAQWCTEQGLLETVEAGKRVSKARVIRIWQQAFPQN